FILGALRDVVLAAVGILGDDGELLLIVPREDAVGRLDRDLGHDRIVLRAIRRARRDPAANQLVLVGVRVHSLAAGVGDLAGGLLQEQAAFGRGREDASAAVLFGQRLEIEFGNEAEQRQREAVLSAGLAVAAAAVAAELGEDRH